MKKKWRISSYWWKLQLGKSDLRQRQHVPNVDRSYRRDLLIGSGKFEGLEYAGVLRLIVGVVAEHLFIPRAGDDTVHAVCSL